MLATMCDHVGNNVRSCWQQCAIMLATMCDHVGNNVRSCWQQCVSHAMFLPPSLLYLSDPWSAISHFPSRLFTPLCEKRGVFSLVCSLLYLFSLIYYIIIFDKIVEFRSPKTVDLYSLSSLIGPYLSY